MNKLHYQHQAFSYSNELLTAYRPTGDLQSCKQKNLYCSSYSDKNIHVHVW